MDTEAHDGMDGMEGGSVTGTNNNNTISPESVFIVIIIIANPKFGLAGQQLDTGTTDHNDDNCWRTVEDQLNSPASQMIKG